MGRGEQTMSAGPNGSLRRVMATKALSPLDEARGGHRYNKALSGHPHTRHFGRRTLRKDRALR